MYSKARYLFQVHSGSAEYRVTMFDQYQVTMFDHYQFTMFVKFKVTKKTNTCSYIL